MVIQDLFFLPFPFVVGAFPLVLRYLDFKYRINKSLFIMFLFPLSTKVIPLHDFTCKCTSLSKETLALYCDHKKILLSVCSTLCFKQIIVYSDFYFLPYCDFMQFDICFTSNYLILGSIYLKYR